MLSSRSRSLSMLAAMSLLLLTGGCSSTAKAKKDPLFYPPAPNMPRVQYLMSINSSTDVEGAKSSLSLFRMGAAPEEEVRPVVKPYGIAARGTTVFVCDLGAARIIRMDLRKKKFEYLKGDTGLGKLKKPVGLGLDAQGNLFVADTMRKDVAMYDSEGNYVRSYGRGVIKNPSGVAADEENVYILDNRGSVIKVIDRNNDEPKEEIGKGPTHLDSLALPLAMTTDQKGLLHVTNMLSGRILTFDRDGHFIRGFGKLGDAFGEFGRPRGIAVDNDNMVYVVDASHQNIQIFNEDARLLMFFGDVGANPGNTNLPAGVSVTADDLDFYVPLADPGFIVKKIIFVTNQFGNNKIAVYALGEPKEWKDPLAKPAKPAAKDAGADRSISETDAGAERPKK